MIDTLPVSPETLVMIGVFLGVLLVFDGIRRFVGRGRTTEALAERRVRISGAGSTVSETLLMVAPKVKRPGLMDRLALSLDGAGIKTKPLALVAIVIGIGLAVFSLASMFLSPLIAVPLTLVLTAILPILVIAQMRKARLDKLTTQLPDALDLMARALKVGHPLNTSIEAVAKELPTPISVEFERMVDQVTYGEDVVKAFRDLAARNRSEDFDYLSVAVAIQHGTGGNLGRVLTVLAKVIRDRSTMRRKIRAISAEGRISAQILSFLPFAIVGMTSLTAPGYYGDVMNDPSFRTFVVATLILVVANMLALRKLVSFRF